MAYTAKNPRPPMAFSVPNRNKKLEVVRRRRRRRRRRKSQSEDPRYCKGAWVKRREGEKSPSVDPHYRKGHG